MALGYISKLYAIEQELRDGSDAERYQRAVTQRAAAGGAQNLVGRAESADERVADEKNDGAYADSGLAW